MKTKLILALAAAYEAAQNEIKSNPNEAFGYQWEYNEDYEWYQASNGLYGFLASNGGNLTETCDLCLEFGAFIGAEQFVPFLAKFLEEKQ